MSNVVSMFGRKKEEENQEVKSEPQEVFSFEETMKQNKEKADRLKKERENSNKGVTRSYRLKKDK